MKVLKKEYQIWCIILPVITLAEHFILGVVPQYLMNRMADIVGFGQNISIHKMTNICLCIILCTLLYMEFGVLKESVKGLQARTVSWIYTMYVICVLNSVVYSYSCFYRQEVWLLYLCYVNNLPAYMYIVGAIICTFMVLAARWVSQGTEP